MYNEEGGSTFYIPRHTSLVRLSYYNKQEGQIEEEEEGKKQKEKGEKEKQKNTAPILVATRRCNA